MRSAVRRAVPLVNASCKPGQWQAYDIVYHRPVFDQSGKVTRKAVITVFHNGILIQDHVALEAAPAGSARTPSRTTPRTETRGR